MKNLPIILILLCLVFSVKAQSTESQKQPKQPNKEAKKQMKAAKSKENKKALLTLAENREFVLEANTVYDKQQNSYPVSSTTNFVKVDGKQMIVQLAFDGLVGWNGIGGITIDGSIVHYTVNNGTGKGPITVIAEVSSLTLGLSTVTISMYNDGLARATVNGSFGANVSFSGNISDFENSNVFKGMSNY